MKNIAIGLVAAAVAIIALRFSRPEPPPPAMLPVVQFDPPKFGAATAPAPATQPFDAFDPKLQAILPGFECDKLPLNEAIDALSRKTSANIIVNWKALEGAGVDAATPITLRLFNVSGERVLDLICQTQQIQATLAFEYADGVTSVSTAEEINRHSVMRLYDVHDILIGSVLLSTAIHRAVGEVPTTEPARIDGAIGGLGAAAGNGQGGVGGAVGVGGIGPNFQPPSYLPETTNDVMQSLVRAIEQYVAPESWREAGGTTGSISAFDGRLIIVQTRQNHRSIQNLLNILRGLVGRDQP